MCDRGRGSGACTARDTAAARCVRISVRSRRAGDNPVHCLMTSARGAGPAAGPAGAWGGASGCFVFFVLTMELDELLHVHTGLTAPALQQKKNVPPPPAAAPALAAPRPPAPRPRLGPRRQRQRRQSHHRAAAPSLATGHAAAVSPATTAARAPATQLVKLLRRPSRSS